MIKTYFKYRSIEEILETLQVKSFEEYTKQKLTQLLLSDSSTQHKVDTILEQRGWG
jgi:hypothetical protein